MLVPHGNEMARIRKMQDEICGRAGGTPNFPLFAEIILEGNDETNAGEIDSAEISEIFSEGGEIFLKLRIFLKKAKGSGGGTEFKREVSGKIKIATESKNPEKVGGKIEIPLPAFRICDVEFRKEGSRTEWSVLSERWV